MSGMRWHAIAATLMERGTGHARYRSELVFVFAASEDDAKASFVQRLPEMRPGWVSVSVACKPVPVGGPLDPPGDEQGGAS